MKWHFSVVLAIALLATGKPAFADIVSFIATGAEGVGLLDGNVDPITGETGTGGIGPTGITFNTNNNILHIDILWGSVNGFVDLSADVQKLHLHGPTPSSGTDAFGETAPLLLTLSNSNAFDPSATSGGLNDNFFIDSGDVQALLDGRLYLNVHLSDTDTGIIRGYLQAVPEPGAGLVLLTWSGLMALRRRKR